MNFHLNGNLNGLNCSCKFTGHIEEHFKMGSQRFTLGMAKIIPICSSKQHQKVLLYLSYDTDTFNYFKMDGHRITEA